MIAFINSPFVYRGINDDGAVCFAHSCLPLQANSMSRCIWGILYTAPPF